MGGWVVLGHPAVHRPGVELAISLSQVRRDLTPFVNDFGSNLWFIEFIWSWPVYIGMSTSYKTSDFHDCTRAVRVVLFWTCSVCLWLCLSVCLSVNMITPERLEISSRNFHGIVLWSMADKFDNGYNNIGMRGSGLWFDVSGVLLGTDFRKSESNCSIFTAQCTLVHMRGLGIACRPSVRPSVTFVDCDHIGWKSWKLITRTTSPTHSLFVAKSRST